jgi:arabinogalactan endo-1,4-beta-galactosidase
MRSALVARIGASLLVAEVATTLLCACRAAEVIGGADFSHLSFFESRGVLYKDKERTEDALAIVKRKGLSCVRLRLFTSSSAQALADPYNYINNLDYTLPLAVRVKNAGLGFMLDFHYSDTWADPGHQQKPAAWTNLNFSQLVQQMHDYSSNCIITFKEAGAMPDFVQVGNEITSGILWPDGKVGGTYETPTQWSQLGQLLNAAMEGIREAAGTTPPRIVIHIDRGGDWATTQWFFDNLRQQQVPFDLIGESYYPFWHGPLSSLLNCLTNAALRYQKPLIVAETAFPWTNSFWTAPMVGLTPSVDGQVRYVAELAAILNRVPLGLASGIFWWGAEYQQTAGVNGAGFDTTSFFNATGNVLPVTEAVGQLSAPVRLSAGFEDSTVSLHWPISGAGLSLRVATAFSGGIGWVTVTNQPQTNSSGFDLGLTRNAECCRFYQLQP